MSLANASTSPSVNPAKLPITLAKPADNLSPKLACLPNISLALFQPSKNSIKPTVAKPTPIRVLRKSQKPPTAFFTLPNPRAFPKSPRPVFISLKPAVIFFNLPKNSDLKSTPKNLAKPLAVLSGPSSNILSIAAL